MKFLHCSIALLLFAACASDYKARKPVANDKACAEKIKPTGIKTAWYTTHIDVIGKHISGLLLVKQMPDSSKRVVFTNEAGVTFLDFEFRADGSFQVKQVIKQLDKKAVVQLLRKDFELMLGIPFRKGVYEAWQVNDERYFGVPQKKETAYFITGADCASLRRIELGSKRKKKVTVEMWGNNLTTPDSVKVKHYTFNMVIGLKKIER
jgi:hypothetical protein